MHGKSQLSMHTPCPPPFTHTVSHPLQTGLKDTLRPSRSPSRPHMPQLLQQALPDARPALSCVEFSSATCSFVPSLESRGVPGGPAATGVGETLPSSGCSESRRLVYAPTLWPRPLLLTLLPPFLKGLLPPFQAHCMSPNPSGEGSVAVQQTAPLKVTRQRASPHPRVRATCLGGHSSSRPAPSPTDDHSDPHLRAGVTPQNLVRKPQMEKPV